MNRPKLRLTLTDEEHDQMNRFRNHVGLSVGYGMILLLAVSGLMVFAGIAIRAAMWMVP
jgi:hypothetical protein